MTVADLPTGTFKDPVRAARTLRLLEEAYIRSGAPHPAEQFFALLQECVTASPDADLALTNLARFTEASFSTASLFTDLGQYPLFLDLLVKLFGYSSYFADILVREPALFRWLTAEAALHARMDRQQIVDETARSMRMFRRPERQLDALKRIHRRELLRIGARDILGLDDLPDVARQLSDLADVIVNAAVAIANGQLAQKRGVAPATAFAVLGLGKLGGRELNYSSDIDILFVYGDEGETPGDQTLPYHAYFNELAEQVTVALAEPTAEGHLYRVDIRLRPEGGAGPLARSLRSYLVYYESRGEIWERQMLIKARPVAGDVSLANAFIAQIEPFVYPRTFLRHPVEAIARIKGRIEAAVGTDANIKLQAGGIRDIEFIAQALQLVNGGRNKEVRSVNTLDALARLGKAGLLNAKEQETLAGAYVFYRNLEHRLQMVLNTQTHVVPEDPAAFRSLARRMGYADTEAFREIARQRLQQVRAIFERVFAVQGASPAEGLLEVLEEGTGEDSLRKTLSAYGLHDVRSAGRNLKTLLAGSSLTGAREVDTRVRDAFRVIAEPLFAEIARTPVPDLTLKNLTTIAAAHRFPGQLYAQLAVSEFRNFLLAICAVSPRFARSLAHQPLLLDLLAGNIAALAGDEVPVLPVTDDLYMLKVDRELLAGIRHILGFTSFEQLTAELTQLADFIVRTLLAQQAGKKMPTAIFALGKYGSRELTFDADLDVMFVSGAAGVRTLSAVEERAADLVGKLTSIGERGMLYGVDVRLRPEGRNAPLVVERSAYLHYLRERASLWERQALTRLRFAAGDSALGNEISHAVDQYVYETALPHGWTGEIVAMRKKMESRSRFQRQASIDIKVGAGGMADVEFAMQMVQMVEGRNNETLRHKSVAELLREQRTEIITAEDLSVLREAYSLFRRLEKHMRITLEEKSSLLPEGEKLEILARCSEGIEGKVLVPVVTEQMRRVRNLFLAIAERCSIR